MAVVTAKRALVAAGIDPVDPVPNIQGEATDHSVDKLIVGLSAIAAVILADVIISTLMHDGGYTMATAKGPVQGLTIFATFFVAAAALERLLQPLAGWLPSATDAGVNAATAKAAAGPTVALAAADPHDSTSEATAKQALTEAAKAADKSSYTGFWKSVLLWALATTIAMAASAGMKLYFLRTVGIASGPRWSEVLATGLIIGSGTKPLHDLVTYIQAASSAKAS